MTGELMLGEIFYKMANDIPLTRMEKEKLRLHGNQADRAKDNGSVNNAFITNINNTGVITDAPTDDKFY